MTPNTPAPLVADTPEAASLRPDLRDFLRLFEVESRRGIKEALSEDKFQNSEPAVQIALGQMAAILIQWMPANTARNLLVHFRTLSVIFDNYEEFRRQHPDFTPPKPIHGWKM
jgi:hypothetical protein